MLAEAVSLDGGALLLILLAALIVLALMVTVVVFGFILAPRAGRGSGEAMRWWIVILALEGLWSLGSIATLLNGYGSVGTFFAPAIVAGQVAMFLKAKRART